MLYLEIVLSTFGDFMADTPDIQTQQQHRAALRQRLKQKPTNEPIRKALLKSVRAKFIQQAATKGVFICYSMSDGVFALNLAESLREIGIRAFLDELEADDDMDWGDTVGQALRNCAVLIMILSPDALEDTEVHAEYDYYMRTGKIIIPVIAEKCSPDGLATVMSPINFLDNYATALKKLKSLLKANETANI